MISTNPEKNFLNTDFGLVDINQDLDGFLRRYIIYQKFPDTKEYNYSLAIETVLKYYNEDSRSIQPIYDKYKKKTMVGDRIEIDTYGAKNSFLLNYYGSSSKALGSSGTFANISLSQILDDDETCFGECIWDEDEEIYIPDDENNELDDDWVTTMQVVGIATSNPVFKDKIVILGPALAEEQDVQSVPLMKTEAGNFLMPGVDIHANAIQQLLHNSYIKSSYNELEVNSYNWTKHIGLIILVVFITLLIVSNFKTFGFYFRLLV